MEEQQVKYQMGSLTRLEAESIGEPGRRTFRLLLEAGEARCTLWLEKEQLYQLGVHLQDAVAAAGAAERGSESQRKDGRWAGDGGDVDFKAGEIRLSHDKEANSFYISAFERENPEQESGSESTPSESPASISFWITMAEAGVLAEDALRICAAGRPSCFLCGQPIDPDGHVCPRSNGHTVLETG